MRKLSIRPLSQHGSSARSSLIPDYQSATFSSGSGAPILHSPSAVYQLPPNKLVKRSPSTPKTETDGFPRTRSRSGLPTLRRPATSHQRSATLQQQINFSLEGETSPRADGEARFSFDRQSHFDLSKDRSATNQSIDHRKPSWFSFFHSKMSNISTPGSSAGDAGHHLHSHNRLIHNPTSQGANMPHLVKAAMIIPTSKYDRRTVSRETTPVDNANMADAATDEGVSPAEMQRPKIESLGEPAAIADLQQKPAAPLLKARMKRSFSWVSKTSGSLRRAKRGIAQPAGGTSGDVRNVSAPVTGSEATVGQRTWAVDSGRPPIASPAQGPPAPLRSALHAQRELFHKRNLSSPPAPLSSFQAGYSRATAPSGSFSFGGGVLAALPHHPTRPHQPSGQSVSSGAMSQRRPSQNDKSSVMEACESDDRAYGFADDDDTDFKSDTLYDSLRTVASSRVRAVETPLESVYDESPPSTAGNNKSKRLSIHDMIGHNSWAEDDDKITEEDEHAQTPVRTQRQPPNNAFDDYDAGLDLRKLTLGHERPPKMDSLVRISMDEDSDEDWARDDDSDEHFNALSPPSKGSSVNSRSGINPNVRLALANIGSSALNEQSSVDAASDRPLSSLFDWSEQTVQDKQEAERRSGRPQTAYAKQTLDARGGRPTVRKAPAPTHVRSQSVPVVHEIPGDSKNLGAKYGTWGLGTKIVSEDWDEDFEFGMGGIDEDEKDEETVFAVPESIRASQLSVRAHSGQIRELSLLVNDLKRLCRHARELDLLDGPQKELWKEAEGVIALASPDDDDEEEEEEDEVHGVELPTLPANVDDVDADFEPPSLPAVISRTGVVRERHSPQRRSVFCPDDDIFGGSPSGTEGIANGYKTTPDDDFDAHGVVRTVMEAMQGRVHSGSAMEGPEGRKVQFDTNSLKALVRRSSELRDILSDSVRKVDQLTESPIRPSRYERGLDSSPAFTRVFDDPGSSPPRRPARSRGNTLMENSSTESSPPRQIGRRFPLMTVR